MGAVVLSAGAAPGFAQTSVTFNFQGGLNTTSLELANPPNPPDLNIGSFTYNGTGLLPSNLPAGFAGITGIDFVNSTSFSYSRNTDPLISDAFITNFSPFYFLGTCPICRNISSTGTIINEGEQITVPDNNGNVTFSPAGTFGTTVTGFGGSVPIRFGSNGSPGSLTFNASGFVATDGTVSGGVGFITFDYVADTSGVPGPLPIFGASVAFAFSRKIRKRISAAQSGCNQ
jgi:hypothetical protein